MHWAQLPGGEREAMGEQERRGRKRSIRLSGILIKCSTWEKGVGKRQWQRPGATKLPLNLIQYCSISVFYPSRVCARECMHQIMWICVRVCVKCAHRHAKIQSYRILHLRYSYALGDFGHSILSLFFSLMSASVCGSAVGFCEQKERGCISMIKRTVTNDCCLGEAMWLSQQDIGQVYQDTRSLVIWRSSLKRDGVAGNERRGMWRRSALRQSCTWQLWEFIWLYMLCIGF